VGGNGDPSPARPPPARNPPPAALSAPMPAPPDFDALREIAGNRGLRLVRSRRRKPGAGDYGKLGVTIARAPGCLASATTAA